MIFYLGGHVFHFACVNRLISIDKENSECPQCRNSILIKPRKLFFKRADPEKCVEVPSPYEVAMEESVTRNLHLPVEVVHNNNNNELTSLIEHYEDRLQDLTIQLENYSQLETDLEARIIQLRQTTIQLNNLRVQLDERNMIMNELLKRKIFFEKENENLKIKLEVSTDELRIFRDTKLAIEVQRIVTEIGTLQLESYYRDLLADSSISKNDVIKLLKGMHTKFKDSEQIANSLRNQLKIFEIDKERMQREERERKRRKKEKEIVFQDKTDVFVIPKQLKQTNNENFNFDDPEIDLLLACLNENKIINTTDDKSKNIIDLESEDHDINQHFNTSENHKNPFSKSKTIPLNSKMVPSILPKGFKMLKSSNRNSSELISNGTGGIGGKITFTGGEAIFKKL